MNYAINVTAAAVAALLAGLCFAGTVQGSSLLLVLCAAVLLLYLIFAGFGRNTCETGPMIVGVYGMIFLLWGAVETVSASMFTAAINQTLRGLIQGWYFSWLPALICLAGILLLSLAQKKLSAAIFIILRYGMLALLLGIGMENLVLAAMRDILPSVSAAKQLVYPVIFIAGLGLAEELSGRCKAGHLWGSALSGFGYALLLAFINQLWNREEVLGRLLRLIRLEGPAMAGLLLLLVITLAGQPVKKPLPEAIRRSVRLAVWLVYLLLLRWRCSGLALNEEACLVLSLVGVPLLGAVYHRLGQKWKQLGDKWYAAPVGLLLLLTLALASLQAEQALRVYLLALALWTAGWLVRRIGVMCKQADAALRCYLGVASLVLLRLARGVETPSQWIAVGILAIGWCGLVVGLFRTKRLSSNNAVWPEEYDRTLKLCSAAPALPALLASLSILF